MAKLLYRLGLFSARHRLAVILAWAAVLITVGVTAVTGMRFSDGSFDIPGTESSKALSTVDREFPSNKDEGSASLQLVLRAPDGAPITGAPYADEVTHLAGTAASISNVSEVRSPFDPVRPYVSADSTTAVISLSFTRIDEANADRIYAEVERIADTARGYGLESEIGGTLHNALPEILGPSEIVGALIAFGVLVITFGSLLAAGANMLTALLGVGVGVLGIFASSAFLQPVGSMTPILAVMLGLAVGIDYSLFIVARFRAELRAGAPVTAAVGRAIGTAGSSVVFAGATVVIALVALAIVRIPFITEMGFAAAFAVVIAVAMSLTLLPVFLKTMGHRALPRKERDPVVARTPGGKDEKSALGILGHWAATVVHRPVRSLLAGVALLAVLAVPVLSLQTGLTTPGGDQPDSSQRKAYNLIAQEFGDGSQNPLVVLVQANDASLGMAAADTFNMLSGLNGVQLVTPPQPSASRTAAIITVLPTTGPTDTETKDLVHEIRERSAALNADIAVTGQTAVSIDVDAQLSQALITYIGVIVGLSLLLLIVLFRSILVPLIATAGFLLSLGAGIGVTVAVFQWGWADALVAAPTGSPMLSLLPILIVGILFGLAMDYQVFLVSRMKEAYSKGYSPKEAILDGFSKTAFVVVAAAAIMAAVFGGFALSPSPLVASIALALTIGVLADAFVVRMIIVPSALSLLGLQAWTMPRWLDKVLPEIDTEGHALEDSLEPESNGAEKVVAGR
ncbi:RND superfamily putative drug exporter [Pseudarthrobacter sp. PvP004]|uniref:MMPL family transporter n=1 Tax=Pseudarthrobacter sp. PvP004 TaxID=2817850 RepID=UPI001AE3696F|nr:MMPL family transporter [Pseudarthrobacter sp. PvP004]MBP2266372.1 RND superfamily putative drug exporter [Pseudarthrobacter sp. PvP004]